MTGQKSIIDRIVFTKHNRPTNRVSCINSVVHFVHFKSQCFGRKMRGVLGLDEAKSLNSIFTVQRLMLKKYIYVNLVQCFNFSCVKWVKQANKSNKMLIKSKDI